MDVSSWTYHESMAFLLVYAGHADGTFDEEEKREVSLNLGRDTYEKMSAVFDGQDQEGLESILQELKIHVFNSPQSYQDLIENLKDIFLADGEYSAGEQKLYRKLRNLLRDF